MRFIRVVGLTIVSASAVLLSHSRIEAQVWSIDILGSSLDLTGDAFADDFIGPSDQDTQTVTLFTPGFTVPGGTFDFGADLVVRAEDGALPEQVSADAGSNFVTITGELSNTLEIRWQAATLLQSLNLDAFLGVANSTTTSTLSASLSLNPGELYRVRYEWSYAADANTDHEGVLEDPEDASAMLDFDFGGTLVSPFAVAVNGDGPLPSGASNSGNGLFFVVGDPGGMAIPLIVDVFADANGTIESPPNDPPDLDDLGGSFAFGQLTLVAERIVPEPSALLLAMLGSCVLATRRRRRRP